MKNNNFLKFCGTLAAAWFSLCFIFPHDPGIVFTGSATAALGLALVSVLAEYVIIGSCSILGILGAVCYAIFSKGDFQVPNRKSITTLFLKVGFWRWVAVSVAFNVVVGGIAWQIVAALFPSLQLVGFFSSFTAAAIVAAVISIPTMLINPSHYSEAYFRKSVTELAESDDKNDKN